MRSYPDALGPRCQAPCPHGHACSLPADHVDGFSCSSPEHGPVHVCMQCNCTFDWVSGWHFHDGKRLNDLKVAAARAELWGIE